MIDKFDAPIPGQSLTTDAENPLPFETSPEFTDKDKLTKQLFERMTEPESIARISEFLKDGVAVETITKLFLKAGMVEGKINTDMQLLMIEPIMYIILFIAERTGIEASIKEEEYLESSLEEEIEDLLQLEQGEINSIKDKLSPSLLSKIEENI